MPGYRNSFRVPEVLEAEIVNEKGAIIGTIRVKPTSILWRTKGQHSFLSVPLDRFIQWIEDPQTSAKTVSK
jgi:hypothetical protein